MSRERQKNQHIRQLDSHHTGWDDNVAPEVMSKYTSIVTQQLERSHVAIGEVVPGERESLIVQPLPESHQHQACNSQERIIREARPMHERPIASCNGSRPIIDQQRPEEPLSLDRQHKVEWETLAAIEAESWRALDKQHQQVIIQLRSAGANWSHQLTALQEQLVEIQNLHRENQQKHALIRQRQAMDQKNQFIWLY